VRFGGGERQAARMGRYPDRHERSNRAAHPFLGTKITRIDGKRVTGVAYTNILNGEEFEAPAG
jgi:hypothetical protein